MKNNLLKCCAVILMLAIFSYADICTELSLNNCWENKLWNRLREISDVEENKPGRSSTRVKRSVMAGSGKCPVGYSWYLVRCWTCDEYTELTGRDCPGST